MLQGLLGACDGSVEDAQWGIIFLDEFDKLGRKSGRGATGYRDVSGEGVQQALLTTVEGSMVRVPMGSRNPFSNAPPTLMDTSNILFICAGSFAGIDDVVNERLSKGRSIGFGATPNKKALTARWGANTATRPTAQ